MAGLTGKSIASAYKSILRVDDNSNGVDATLESITDGEGNKSALELCDDNLRVVPQNDDSTAAFEVRAKGGTPLLTVDSTNSVVKAGVGQFNALTQYAYFGIHSTETSSNAAGYHYPLCFANTGLGDVGIGDQLNHFGNSADPATSFTTADATDQRASALIRYLWFIPDNISIDSVTSLEGADAATGDTTRFHLMSYTINSGSTSCLADGTLIAHSSDQANSGAEQVYRNTWTVDSASVAAGKVLVCTFEADGANSDYSYQAIVKYHLV
tara:strand:- start:1776 stop:2582 length:807 start_codon:yes stop_codon:yes gene_type:complete